MKFRGWKVDYLPSGATVFERDGMNTLPPIPGKLENRQARAIVNALELMREEGGYFLRTRLRQMLDADDHGYSESFLRSVKEKLKTVGMVAISGRRA